MNIKRTITVAAVAVGMTGTALVGAGLASAHPANDGSLVERIATRFNLNQNEVQQVVDELHSEHQAERQAKAEERLSKAVEDGTLTADQKEQLQAKLEELKTFRESLADKSPEERREAMKEKREELKAWAEEQNLDLKELMPGPRGMRGHHGDRK